MGNLAWPLPQWILDCAAGEVSLSILLLHLYFHHFFVYSQTRLPDAVSGTVHSMPALDTQWIEMTSKKMALRLEKLDTDLKNYKSNSIKESIRYVWCMDSVLWIYSQNPFHSLSISQSQNFFRVILTVHLDLEWKWYSKIMSVVVWGLIVCHGSYYN